MEKLDYSVCDDLPHSIAALKHLEYFHYVLSPGQGKIPSAVFSMTSLKTLYIEGNDLATVPKEITNLQQLETIDFGISPINELPDFLGKLPHLQHIHLSLGAGTPDEAKIFQAKFSHIQVHIG